MSRNFPKQAYTTVAYPVFCFVKSKRFTPSLHSLQCSYCNSIFDEIRATVSTRFEQFMLHVHRTIYTITGPFHFSDGLSIFENIFIFYVYNLPFSFSSSFPLVFVISLSFLQMHLNLYGNAVSSSAPMMVLWNR